MDSVNVPVKFEVRSFTRSWDNKWQHQSHARLTCTKAGDSALELHTLLSSSCYNTLLCMTCSLNVGSIMHLKHRWACHGSLSARKNTWMADSKNISKTLGLLFCWLNKISVTTAAAATECSANTAVDHYSMAWEVCEVTMTNEVTYWCFCGPGIQVKAYRL